MRGPGSIEPAEVVDEDDDVEDPAVELEIEKVNMGCGAYQVRIRRGEAIRKGPKNA